MSITEEQLRSWSAGPSQTESDKCQNAKNMIRKAIKASDELQNRDISVFAQGSYKANTNVRKNSDVDICIRYNGSFFPDYPKGATQQTFGHVKGEFPFTDFKNLVEDALVSYFGEDGVTRGNKAFDVHANSYRVDADVVPTFEHRRYTGNTLSDGTDEILYGVAFKPDKGSIIKNWPDQTYCNGIERNNASGRRYKRVIRILKRIRDRLKDDGDEANGSLPSFLIESLVWNADTSAYAKDTYWEMMRHVIANLWNQTRKDDDCSDWGEVNELKYLFRDSQPWTRQQANDFLQSIWDYIGYK
tara:strand:+ start:20528 stop:21430 length:903 start_codon:yes stop_codon:yes gene_type:complete